jgi:hypothetical protein
MNFKVGDRASRTRTGDRVVGTVTDRVTGGVNLTVPAALGILAASAANSDQSSFPQTQNANFELYAVCRIAVCGDGAKAGP